MFNVVSENFAPRLVGLQLPPSGDKDTVKNPYLWETDCANLATTQTYRDSDQTLSSPKSTCATSETTKVAEIARQQRRIGKLSEVKINDNSFLMFFMKILLALSETTRTVNKTSTNISHICSRFHLPK